MSSSPQLEDQVLAVPMTELLSSLEERLGHSFSVTKRLELALTHKSFANEQNANSTKAEARNEALAVSEIDNERYEFLGDAVLDLALSEVLMRRFPSDPEGALSKKRASLVNEETLSKLALEFKIEGLVRLGKGEIKTGGLSKPRILASTFEAILGAVFLDAGYEKAVAVVERVFYAKVEELASSAVDFRDDYKTRLQETAQEIFRSTPTYRVESESGPDHSKVFDVTVHVDGRILGEGAGRSKKAAEQDAARKALIMIEAEQQKAAELKAEAAAQAAAVATAQASAQAAAQSPAQGAADVTMEISTLEKEGNT